MKIITISREFGSGGRELGKRLADILGFDYYDKEIIKAVAKNMGVNAEYAEKSLENCSLTAYPISFRHSFAMLSVNNTASLLVEEKKVIESIAKTERDCVIVGRNADILLKDRNPFNIFVCADMYSKIKRCEERAASQMVGGIFPLCYFARKNDSILRLGKANFDGKALLKACTNGSSEFMSNISMSLVGMLYNIQLLKYAGENGVAAYGVMMYVSLIFAGAFIGYSIGTAPIFGYHDGAKNHVELKSLLKKA